MKNLFFEYYKIDEEEWNKISKNSSQKFKKLFWKIPYEKYQVLLDDDIEKVYKKGKINELVKALMNKMGTLRISYIFLTYYYNLGIPDDKWCISPGKNGSSIQYFPDFEEKHFYIHYFFNFWAEVFYIKFFSIIDIICDLLNNYYEMGIKKETKGFRRKVIKNLKKENLELFKFLENIKNKREYKNAKEFRNRIIHSIPAYEISNQNEIKKYENKIVEIKFGAGKYTKSSEIKENAEEVLILLKNIFEKLKENLNFDD
ncbi:MAG TPA: Cthe_2314 family HEPN domain-containing protein [bacterium]|nr:Cthe_2314 family HEPN domain-containing protein [bacterium]HOM27795.1 Cthe_2314 family HEPN domain-containing protein [bacterium]